MGHSQAYIYGQKDGQQWDLSAFEDEQAIRKADKGWDEATIRAMGVGYCETQWGVSIADADAWAQACEDYNQGCYEAVIARIS